MDVFSPALEIRNAGSPVDVFTPTPRNWEELERPVDVFSPVPLNKRELVSPGDVFSLMLKIKTVSKSGGYFYPNS